MKDIIFEFVRSFGVLIILRKKLISGALDYYFIDWMGTDSQFYSLLVICNESQIFSSIYHIFSGNCGIYCIKYFY